MQTSRPDYLRIFDDARRVKRACLLVCIAVITILAWDLRFKMNTDGVAYLDLADQIRQGNWSDGLSAYWSPLLIWLLAAFFRGAPSSPRWEFPLVHVLLYLITLAALAAFSWFLEELLACWREGESEDAPHFRAVWYIFGYALFLAFAQDFTWVGEVTPDMLAGALFFVIAAFILRIVRYPESLPLRIGFGLALGLGALARSALFPLEIVLVCVMFLRGGLPRARHLATIAAFALVFGPWMAYMSQRAGHITFAENGKFNLAWVTAAADVPMVGWMGQPPGTGAPLHPIRILLEDPTVWEFDGPIPGTYPPWVNPAYWQAGLTAGPHLPKLLTGLLKNLQHKYFERFARDYSVLWIGLVVCFLARDRFKRISPTWSPVLLVFLLSLAVFAEYAVIWVDDRYVGAAFALAILTLYYAAGRHWAVPGVTFYTVMLIAGLSVGLRTAQLVPGALGRAVKEATPSTLFARHVDLRVAEGLGRMGLYAGDKIATIGRTDTADSESLPINWTHFFARVGRYRVVAEVPELQVEAFWKLDEPGQERVFRALAAHGVRAVVTSNTPLTPPPATWRRVPATPYYVHFL